jgi:hypothetical protein
MVKSLKKGREGGGDDPKMGGSAAGKKQANMSLKNQLLVQNVKFIDV